MNGTRTSIQIPTWITPAYKPDCADRDANDFKPRYHKKYENPGVSDSVSEPGNCLGCCHIYTDSLLTTIKDHRNGEHQTTDGGF
ncbi:MAG: hypothetical protein ACERLB_10160 [Gammaproteobacteria bacterium]